MTTTLLDYTLPVNGQDQAQEITDDVLMQAFSGGHAEWATEQLYARYKQCLYGLAYRILRDSYLAEDVIQEVFLTLWHKASVYQKELGSLKSWLQVIVRNRALDKVRSALYRESQFVHLQTIDGQDVASREPEMWQKVWGGEQTMYIRKALDELPSEQRQAIEMNYFGGYTHAEIASRLQLPIGTVQARIRLGLLKIKTRLQAEGIEMSA